MAPQQKIKYDKGVNELDARHKRLVENLVIKEFPSKVALLDDLLHSDQFSTTTLGRLMEETTTV